MRAEQLTSALEAGDFEAAERVAIEYGNSIAAELRAGGDIAVLREALDAFNNSLHLTRVLRAHLAAQVRANSPAIEYQPAAAENRRWQFEA
jgi:hypothetical protein